MKETTKYNQMLTAFYCDFALAKDERMRLGDLDDLIKKSDERLLKDIKLLEELDFNLRHGKIKIVEVD